MARCPKCGVEIFHMSGTKYEVRDCFTPDDRSLYPVGHAKLF